MVLGDHGRKVLYPMNFIQRFATFPWARYYQGSMYFRAASACGLAVASTWLYVLVKGIDPSFTPYIAVHHSISHKFGHDLDHARYPVDHNQKKH